jgi:hypothetical protein
MAFLGRVKADNFIASAEVTNNGVGTLILTPSSNHIQTLTGTSVPIIRLPDTTTLSVGHSFTITNLSDVQVMVNHSGGTELRTLPTSGTGVFTCMDTSANLPNSWNYTLSSFSSKGEPTPLPAIRTVSTTPYTMLKTDTSLIFTVTCVVTLFSPAALVGKVICIKAIAPVAITSDSANVVPIDDTTPGTAIVSGAGEHVKLQSDGTNWVKMGEVVSSGGSSGSTGTVQISDGSGGFTSDTDLVWNSTTNSLNLGSGSEIIFTGDKTKIGAATTTVGDFAITGSFTAATTLTVSAAGGLITQGMIVSGGGTVPGTRITAGPFGVGPVTYLVDTANTIGVVPTTVSGEQEVAIGESASATSVFSVAIGDNAQAPGQNCIAIGTDTFAQGVTPDRGGSTVAVGARASCPGTYGISIGQDSLSSTLRSLGLGNNARCSGIPGVCIGKDSIVGGINGVAVGDQSADPGTYGVAIGFDANCQGPIAGPTNSFNLALGRSAQAGVNTGQQNCTAVGGEALNQQGTALGSRTLVQQDKGIAIGFDAYSGGGGPLLAFPFDIGGASTAVVAGAPTGGLVGYLRLHVGDDFGPANDPNYLFVGTGQNYLIPLYPDE